MTTKDMFESELSTIDSSFRFQSMLEHNADLREEYKKDAKRTLIAYHAFKSGCSEQLLDNPMVIGGFVRRVIEEPANTAGIVTQARTDWGPR